MFIGRIDPLFCKVPVQESLKSCPFYFFFFWEGVGEKGGRKVRGKLSDFFLLTYSLHIQDANPGQICIVNIISFCGLPFYPLIGIF